MSYRLPDNLVPEYYTVEILANLADLNKNFTFDGRVWIQMNCVKPTNKIVLHSKNLVIDEANVLVTLHDGLKSDKKAKFERQCISNCKDGFNLKILNHWYHDDYEFYVITLAEELQPGLIYSVTIPYHGEITQGLVGFYRSSYKDLETGETRWMGVTQFESTDARRALPCFDEPAFKARFQVNLGHINTRTSISNMRIVSTIPVNNLQNWVWDQYEVTVPMSTYLLAFVVSDFSHKVSPKLSGNDVLFRVWARKDAINQVDYASIVGPRVLSYFEMYFDVKYPLPKMDMIAIPDFSSGAMENWGLITYREVALLYDSKISTASSQVYVASVVAHELAHQWFGNLVTMKWWTDLWLNEGFATYVAALGVNFLHPEWNSLDEEVVDNMMNVFSLDSLKSSHPISVPIGHPREIAQIFDTISYKKGSFVLRMMNLFLGEETFRTGVSNYLKKHAYGNAEQDDLWESLTEVAHKNQVLPQYMSVKQIMDSWTVQTGYPLITVIRNYEACTAVVFQERFLGDRGTSEPDESALKNKWWVPLSYTWQSYGNFNETRPKEWLAPEQENVVIRNLPCNDWVIFNLQISGLYKVKYDVENWNRLTNTLLTNHNAISKLNRVQLIEDSMDLAKTGDIVYTIPFNILKYLENENDYLPWKTALRNLGFVDKMLRFYPTYGYFRSFMKNLLANIYYKTSNEKYANIPENLSKIKLQSLIAAWACKFEVGDCREKAILSFKEWMTSNDPDTQNDIPKDYRSHVYCTAVRYGGEKEWNFLWNRYLKSNVGNERSLILSALSCSREIWLLNRYLEWSLNESSGIRKQDSTAVFAGIAKGDIGYYLAKIFFKDRLADIYKFFGPKATRLGSYFGVLANQATTIAEYTDLATISQQNEEYLRHSQQAVKQGIENAKINIQWQQKFYYGLSEYLKSQAMHRQN
ncbi:hypothetical protein RUM44_005293 [Polyplax serrata]|uniref:Aminopeptidase n=1 Tax=Polyplax serrata TaxID=468196 RepID=A0ABR1AEL0_POLSC